MMDQALRSWFTRLEYVVGGHHGDGAIPFHCHPSIMVHPVECEHGCNELAWIDHSEISDIKLLVHIGHQIRRVLQWLYEQDYHLWPAACC